ncbi:hypothetical protein RUND412_010249, partial [Rhizina undulata]
MRLQVAHNEALHLVIGCFRNAPISSLQVEAATLPVPVIMEAVRRRYAIRLLTLSPQHAARQHLPTSFPNTPHLHVTLKNILGNAAPYVKHLRFLSPHTLSPPGFDPEHSSKISSQTCQNTVSYRHHLCDTGTGAAWVLYQSRSRWSLAPITSWAIPLGSDSEVFDAEDFA